jgi:hypothetical protein
MLGVRRTRLTMVEQAGLIKYQRGKIQVLDVETLHDASCECYDAIYEHYEPHGVAGCSLI